MRWLASWQQPADQGFDLIFPWWRGEASITGCHRITAAIIASDKAAAREAVAAVQAGPVPVEWNFLTAKPDDWDPFTDARPREDWMVWPGAEEPRLRPVPDPAANDEVTLEVVTVCKVDGCERGGAVMMSTGGRICWACLIASYHPDAVGLMA